MRTPAAPIVRRCAPLLLPVLFAPALPAQAAAPAAAPARASPFNSAVTMRPAPPLPAEVRAQLWVGYSDAPQSPFAEHRQYLDDLQRRFGEQGLRVCVVLGQEACAAVAATAPAFRLGHWRHPVHMERKTMHAVLCDAAGRDLAAWDGLDGAVDLVEAALAGAPPPADIVAAIADVDNALQEVGEGFQDGEQVERLARLLPRSGRALALRALHAWWCTGDLDAADASIQESVRTLAGEAVPLVEFADLVMRGGRLTPALQREFVMVLTPASAAASDGPMTQLTCLRALLLAGLDRPAGRLAARLPALLEGRPLLQLWLAETLMEAATPAAFRDAAEQALRRAEGGVDARLLAGVRHKVLVRGGAPQADVDACYAAYRQTEDHELNGLNADAWSLLTMQPTMGRCDTLARALAETMLERDGAGLESAYQDTLALSWYRNGLVGKAVELQATATRAAGGSRDYAARLARFEAALSRQERRGDGDKE